MTDKLSALEREVEQARAKLSNDLAFLRSRRGGFSVAMKSQAQSFMQRMLDDLKARAAANPSAALIIGAGVAWRLLKDPPITTALIGAGMLSLWRTSPMRLNEGNYLSTAQRRFGEQIGEAVDNAKDYAAETVVATREKIGAHAQSAVETVERVVASGAEEVADTLQTVREAAKHMPEKALRAAQSATAQFGRAEDVRDQLLLGVAGLAIAAAVGIAYQRRASNELRPWDY